jgi:hypothetical protein
MFHRKVPVFLVIRWAVLYNPAYPKNRNFSFCSTRGTYHFAATHQAFLPVDKSNAIGYIRFVITGFSFFLVVYKKEKPFFIEKSSQIRSFSNHAEVLLL